MAAPHQPPWHTLTPEQQAWHWQQAHQAQALHMQREQLRIQQRNRNTVNTLVGLFVWTPLIIGGVILLLYVVTNTS